MGWLKLLTLAGAAALVWRAARRPHAPPSAAHFSEREADYRRARHRILVLGGGFSGLAAALALDRQLGGQPDTSILVVDRDNSSLFTPLLWTVADGRADVADAVVPIRAFQRGRRFHVLHAEVQGIDLDRQEVQTDAGSRPYDHLVIALGSVTELPPLPGVREHARLFRTPADAVGLRDRLIDVVEAAHRTDDTDERRSWLTVVVAGAGDTGVELASVIHSYLSAGLLEEYPWLAERDGGPPFRVVLVGRAPRLLPMTGPEESEYVQRALERAGVELWTGTSVEAVRPDAVVTSRGVVPARTVFWAAGIAAPPVLRDLSTEHAKGGTLVVDDRFRLPNRPNVYAVGDAAWAFDADGQGLPPTAQAAMAVGAHVGRLIAAQVLGRPEPPRFRYVSRGHLTLLGPRAATARVGPVLLTGLPAWALWHAYYLYRVPSWKRRVTLFTDWALSALIGREVAQVRLGGPRTTRAAEMTSSLPTGSVAPSR
ncbi:MAG TPA: NAD(P)/FAD-dependent oxidoreductase [Chloroflexota bacterium]|nr:NAD(P)/FAD-dependent oxidoreductase [Chloroflexota bacterium]